jgi:hypothetical protein
MIENSEVEERCVEVSPHTDPINIFMVTSSSELQYKYATPDEHN